MKPQTKASWKEIQDKNPFKSVPLIRDIFDDVEVKYDFKNSDYDLWDCLNNVFAQVANLCMHEPDINDWSKEEIETRLILDPSKQEPVTEIKLTEIPGIVDLYKQHCKVCNLPFVDYKIAERDYRHSYWTYDDYAMPHTTIYSEHLVGRDELIQLKYALCGKLIVIDPLLAGPNTFDHIVHIEAFLYALSNQISAFCNSKLEDVLPTYNSETNKPQQEDYSNVLDKEAFARDRALTESTKLIEFPKNITTAKSRIAQFKRRLARNEVSLDNQYEQFVSDQINNLKGVVKSAKNEGKPKDPSFYEKKVTMAIASLLNDDGMIEQSIASDKMTQAIVDFIDDAQWCILPCNSESLNTLIYDPSRFPLTSRSTPAYDQYGNVNLPSSTGEAQIRIEALKRHVYKTTDRITDEQHACMKLLAIMSDGKDIILPIDPNANANLSLAIDELGKLLTPRGEINKDTFNDATYKNALDNIKRIYDKYKGIKKSTDESLDEIYAAETTPYSYDYEQAPESEEQLKAMSKLSLFHRHMQFGSPSSRDMFFNEGFELYILCTQWLKKYSRKLFFDFSTKGVLLFGKYIDDNGSLVNTLSNANLRELSEFNKSIADILVDLEADPDKARFKYY